MDGIKLKNTNLPTFIWDHCVLKSGTFKHQSKLSQCRTNKLSFFYIWRCDINRIVECFFTFLVSLPCLATIVHPSLRLCILIDNYLPLTEESMRGWMQKRSWFLTASATTKNKRLKPLLLPLNLCHHLRSNVHWNG